MTIFGWNYWDFPHLVPLTRRLSTFAGGGFIFSQNFKTPRGVNIWGGCNLVRVYILGDLVFPELVLPQGKTQMNRHLGRTRIVDAIFFFCIWRGVLFFFLRKTPQCLTNGTSKFHIFNFFAMGIHFKNWPLIFFNPYIPRLLLEPEFSFGCLLLCVFVIRCLLLVLSLWTVRTLELEFFFAECKCLSSLED